MKKIVRLGETIEYGRPCDVYAKIEISDGNLSICGVEGPKRNGDCIGAAGQIVISRPEISNLAPGWTVELLEKFWQVWARWHLNDMNSACVHQRELGWTYETHRGEIDNDRKNKDGYTLAPKFNPYIGHKCPVCGYRIGSAWLKEELPQEVITFLLSLPITDKQPAWV